MDNKLQSNGNLMAAVEAVLFVHGEPIKIKELIEILESDEKSVRNALTSLSENMKDETRGLNLIILDDKATLTTKPELQNAVTKIVKEELDSDLSSASLETLAIIAYLGPVSRAEIEYIRGVNSSFILRSLMIRGLVQREHNKAANFLYNITFDFFKHIGINSQDGLPDFEKYRNLIKNFSGQGGDKETSK